MRALRLAGRAGQPAEDAGGPDGDIGIAVIGGVAGEQRGIERIVGGAFEQHARRLAPPAFRCRRKSGGYSRCLRTAESRAPIASRQGGSVRAGAWPTPDRVRLRHNGCSPAMRRKVGSLRMRDTPPRTTSSGKGFRLRYSAHRS